jgi:hypothetical protein
VFLEALLQGFATFGSVVGVWSASSAFQAWVAGGFEESNPRISEGLSFGVAASFAPAVVLGAVVVSYASTL